jgi:hypothetical protein
MCAVPIFGGKRDGKETQEGEETHQDQDHDHDPDQEAGLLAFRSEGLSSVWRSLLAVSLGTTGRRSVWAAVPTPLP